MADVAIIGAGELGGTLAHVLARSDVALLVRLIDETGRIAEGKALDIMQSAPVHRFATRVAGSTDLTTAAGAAVVFLADRAHGAEWQEDEGLMLLRRIKLLGSAPIVVCAGASQRVLVERGVRELGFARARLLGSAPEALAAAARAIVALEIGGSPHDVGIAVLGVPPSHIVVPWQEASVAGFAAVDVLDEPTRRRLSGLIPALWPPGPHALASAATSAARALIGGSRRRLTVFVGPDDASGRRTRAAALPVQLGPGGIVRVEIPALTGQARVTLENAMGI